MKNIKLNKEFLTKEAEDASLTVLRLQQLLRQCAEILHEEKHRLLLNSIRAELKKG